MSSYLRQAYNALRNAGLAGSVGSLERRVVQGLRTLGNFHGSTVGALGGAGRPLSQLLGAMSPRPAYGGSFYGRLVDGGPRKFRDEVLAAISAGQQGGGGGGGGPVTIGEDGPGDFHTTGINSGFIAGSGFQAAASGTLDVMHLVGGFDYPDSNYRLVIYAATSESEWGAKLGETAVTVGLGTDVQKDIALLVPVPVVQGQWYALCIHTGPGTADVKTNSAPGGNYHYIEDAFANGAAANAAPTAVYAAGKLVLWATG